MMRDDWPSRCHLLAHDWLKNSFLPNLSAFANIMSGKAQDPQAVRRLANQVLPQWETRFCEALQLVNSYQDEMSPLVWFKQRFQDKGEEPALSFLIELTHGLWLFRHLVPEQTRRARCKLLKANRAWKDLRDAFRNYGSLPANKLWPRVREPFLRFQKACNELMNVFEGFKRGEEWL